MGGLSSETHGISRLDERGKRRRRNSFGSNATAVVVPFYSQKYLVVWIPDGPHCHKQQELYQVPYEKPIVDFHLDVFPTWRRMEFELRYFMKGGPVGNQRWVANQRNEKGTGGVKWSPNSTNGIALCRPMSYNVCRGENGSCLLKCSCVCTKFHRKWVPGVFKAAKRTGVTKSVLCLRKDLRSK